MAAIKRLTHAGILATGLFLLSDGASFAADQTVSTAPVIPDLQSNLMVQAVGAETFSYDTNPLMLLQGEKTLYGSITSPELIVNDETPTGVFSTDTLINENQFNDQTFNSTDVHSTIKLGANNERWATDVTARTDYDTTRTSELTTYGFNTTPVRHTAFNLAPEVSFSPVATDKFTLQASGALADYAGSTYQNYEIFSLTPSYAHNFDPLNAATFSVAAQQYRTTSGAQNTTNSVAPSVGWVTEFTPRFSGKATVGLQATKTNEEGTASQPLSIDYIYSLDLSFRGEQDTTDLITSRANYPFGNGTEALLTSFSFTESHQLNPRFSLNFAAAYESGTYQATTIGSLNDLYSLNAGLTYHATDHIDATAGYQYRYETITNTTGQATDNLFTLGVSYHPQSWAL